MALEAERERLVLFVPVAFGAGDALYLSLLREPRAELAVAAGLMAVIGAVMLRDRLTACFLLSLAAAFWAGFAWTQWTAQAAAAPVLDSGIDPCFVEGRVTEIMPLERGGTRIVLSLERMEPSLGAQMPLRLRINFRGALPEIEPGDSVRLMAGLMPPPAPLVPGGFDIARALWFQRIGGVGFAYGAPRILSKARDAQDWLTRLRYRISERIQAVLPGATGGVANAILTGTKGHIPTADADHLRDSGLAHLLVVAGMHMGFVASLVFLILRGGLALFPSIALRHPTKKWAAAATIGACLLYLVLTGAAPPTQRAFVMIAMVMLAVLFDRRAFSMRVLALAAMVVLIATPEAITGPSFQMSFAAVGCLIAAHESGRLIGHSGRPGGMRALFAHFGTIATTTMVATFATEPYAAYHFNHLALYSLPANLFAVPITAFWSMPLGLLALMAMPIGADRCFLQAMGLGIDAVLWAARGLTSLPGAIGHVAAVPVAALICFSGGLVWICLWQLPWRWLGAFPVLSAAVLWCLAARPDLLIDASGTTLALREADGVLRLAPGRIKPASAESWLARDGQPIEALVRRATLSCAGESCQWRAPNGATLCWKRKDSIILALEQQGRRLAISRADLIRSGAISLRFEAPDFRLAYAIPPGLERPWARSIVAADESDQTALNLDTVGSEDSSLISGIGGFERD